MKKKKNMNYSRGSGKNHPMWKGGRNVAWNGYVRILDRNHPRALSNGYVWEHIVVMEIKLGRPLKYHGRMHSKNEYVHHIDGNKQNNHPNNLEVFSNENHIKKEWRDNPLKFPQSKLSQQVTPKRYEKWLKNNALVKLKIS